MPHILRQGCPGSLAAAFWLGWLVTGVVAVVDPRVHAPAAAALLAVLLAGWSVLPWERVRGWRCGLPAVFVVAVLTFAVVGAGAVVVPLLLAALANLVFSLGRVAAIGVAAVVWLLPFVGAGPDRPVVEVVVDAVALAVLAFFAVAMADAVLAERARRAEADDLAAQVEELTITAERARMARDMHDSLGHALAAVKLSLDVAARLDARGESSRSREEVAHAGRIVTRALTDTRRWVRALRPAALDDGFGPRALEELAGAFRGAGIRITHRVVGDLSRMSAGTQLIAYRVVQEGLANAVRHSRAASIDIEVEVRGSTMSCTVTDDGVGIGDAGPVAGGFGLAALDERVRAVGGSFSAADQAGGGCRVHVVLPL